MKAIPILVALALSAPSAAAQKGEQQLGDTIRAALAKQGEIVTAADRRVIATKCGLPTDAPQNNINLNDGALRCPDGRIVRDEETRALADSIGKRASTYAAAAVNSPEVVAAINAYADEATIKALKAVREGKR